MSEVDVEGTANNAAETLAGPKRSPWRSLLWFTLMLGVGYFMLAPFLGMRSVVLIRFSVTQNSLI